MTDPLDLDAKLTVLAQLILASMLLQFVMWIIGIVGVTSVCAP